MGPLLDGCMPSQVAVITPDIEKSAKQFAAFFGTEVPAISTGGVYEVTKCEYMGEPAEESGAKLAFFNLPGIQVELIEPYGGKSTWQDFLDETGGGIHHFGYQVEDIDASMKKCEEFGFKMTQKGNYGDGSGMYVYYDAREQLNCFIELLHSFK